MKDLDQLRAAVAQSPDNIYLRKLYNKALLEAGKYNEAEIEIKESLKIAPEDSELKILLAEAFLELNKLSLGLVLIEEMTSSPTAPALAWLIYAKLLMASDQAQDAQIAYEKAVIIDPSLKDSFLEAEINLQAATEGPQEPEKLKLGGSSTEIGQEDKYLDIERPKIGFEQVGGMDAVKEEVKMKIIHPLEHPEIYKAYGKKIGGGILLYGPPGCGKTLLARATAGEVKSNFINIGISDILDMYVGQSERNLHAIFEKGRKMKPSVLFFDEVDALGANRNDMRHSASRKTINQFLSEMDGVSSDNEGLLILAATNAPWHLDPAFRRPGRFDRIIFVPPPDEAAREAILKIHLKEKPTKNINYDKLVKKTADFSGADLMAVVDRAIEGKLEEAMKKGMPQPIETDDLLKAIKKTRPSTKEWFSTAKNYALFANEGGLYDEILSYLNIKK
ncbi:MAG: AAA family ATPase [Bacteroidia bacterium]|nr:AAA family ATPase [Bacteroidia bacterium]